MVVHMARNDHFLWTTGRNFFAIFASLLFFVFCGLFFAKQSFAVGNTYYVAPTGADTNAGTIAAPFKTIDKGIAMAVPGDTVYVRAGTYPAFNVNKSGTATAPITVSGYGNEYPLISGGGPTIKTYQRSYIVINGFEVTGSTNDGGIRADQSSYITISNNKVHDNYGSNVNGIKLLSSSNSKVIGNIVYSNSFSGIHIYGSTANNNEVAYNTVYNHTISTGNSDGIGCNGGYGQNIHHNTVYGNSDDGIDTWSCTNNTIAYNIVYKNGGTGDGNGIKSGGLPIGGHNVVTHNISYGNYSDGITGNGSGGNLFKNNVTYGNAHDGIGDGWRTNAVNDPTSYINNISFGNTRYDVSMSSGYVGTSHNNLWGNATWNYNGAMTLAQFYTASGFDNPNAGALSSLTGDPLFVNPSGADFHLQSTAKACTSGENGQYMGVYPCSGIVATPTPTAVVTPTPTQSRPTPTKLPTPTPTKVPTVTPTPTPTRLPTPTPIFSGGFSAEYFNNKTLSGTPIVKRSDALVNFFWGTSYPATGISANDFSVRWTKAETFLAGSYTFTVRADDGIRIFMDGVRIYNNWSDHSASTITFTKTIGAGVHTIKIEYYEHSGNAEARVSWVKI